MPYSITFLQCVVSGRNDAIVLNAVESIQIEILYQYHTSLQLPKVCLFCRPETYRNLLRFCQITSEDNGPFFATECSLDIDLTS